MEGQVYDYRWRKFAEEAPTVSGEYLCKVEYGGAEPENEVVYYDLDERKGHRWGQGSWDDTTIVDDSDVEWWTNLPPNPSRQ